MLRRTFRTGGISLLVLLWAQSAMAEEARRGGDLWLSFEPYLGYTTGDYVYEGPVNPGFGQTGSLVLESRLSGFGLGLAGVAGAALSERFALGVEPSVSIFGSKNQESLGHTNIDAAQRFGLMLSFAHWPIEELPLRASFGVLRVAFIGATNDIGAADNIIDLQPLSGFAGRFSAGWAPNGVGVLGSVGYARLEDEHAAYTPLDLTVSAVFSTL